MPDITGFNTFNPMTLERLASNKGFDEFNDNFLDDFFFTDSGSVKFDEAWLDHFMEPTSTNINDNLMKETLLNRGGDSEAETEEQQNKINISEITAVDNSPC